MHPRHIRIEDYTYSLPEDRIAKHPVANRDESRLLIYKNGEIQEDIYKQIAQYIPENTLMVFNHTRVVQARLLFQKPTGAVIEIFCLEPDAQYPDIQTALAQQREVVWNCLVGGASKWKKDSPLIMACEELNICLKADFLEHKGDHSSIRLSWDNDSIHFAEVLENCGKIPLPPYLGRNSQIEDKDRYQTVFAKEEGSVAAPTAGLHFTKGVLESLAQRHIKTDFITLHVGAGTFRPVKAEQMEGHAMHAEWIQVGVNQLDNIIAHLDKTIVATGTTTLRTLESLYWLGNQILNGQEPDLNGIAVTQWVPYEAYPQHDSIEALKTLKQWLIDRNEDQLITRTQILIAPGYTFKVVKGLVTNFHQPGSTLLLLVAAFVGDDWRKIYDYALSHSFRFLSYGDGSLIWLPQ